MGRRFPQGCLRGCRWSTAKPSPAGTPARRSAVEAALAGFRDIRTGSSNVAAVFTRRPGRGRRVSFWPPFSNGASYLQPSIGKNGYGFQPKDHQRRAERLSRAEHSGRGDPLRRPHDNPQRAERVPRYPRCHRPQAVDGAAPEKFCGLRPGHQEIPHRGFLPHQPAHGRRRLYPRPVSAAGGTHIPPLRLFDHPLCPERLRRRVRGASRRLASHTGFSQ